MKTGARLFLPLIIFALFIIAPLNVFAHPGNTAADGCHYCRTNCAKWGEVEGARHCHGGGSAPASVAPVYTSAPTATPKPTKTATPKPTLKPTTPTPTKSPTPASTFMTTATPTVTGEVQSFATESSQPQVSAITETEEDLSTRDWIVGLTVLGGLIATPVWVGKKIIQRIRR